MAVPSPVGDVKIVFPISTSVLNTCIDTQIKDFVHTSCKTQSFALRGKGSENVVKIYETSGGSRGGARAPSYF